VPAPSQRRISRSSRKARRSTELVVRDDGRVERVHAKPLHAQAVEAASQPLNLVVLGALVAAQLLLGLHPLVTLLVYGLLFAASFVQQRTRSFGSGSFRAREAVMHLPPTLRTRVLNVFGLVERVHDDVALLDTPPEGVVEGLDQLVATLIETAQQAAGVDEYLGTVRRGDLAAQAAVARERVEGDPGQEPIAQALEEQLAVVDGLLARRRQLDTDMEQIAANLGVLHARIVQARVESEHVVRVDDELTILRDRTRALAEGMREVREIQG
jgi:hypothetical protein